MKAIQKESASSLLDPNNLIMKNMGLQQKSEIIPSKHLIINENNGANIKSRNNIHKMRLKPIDKSQKRDANIKKNNSRSSDRMALLPEIPSVKKDSPETSVVSDLNENGNNLKYRFGKFRANRLKNPGALPKLSDPNSTKQLIPSKDLSNFSPRGNSLKESLTTPPGSIIKQGSTDLNDQTPPPQSEFNFKKHRNIPRFSLGAKEPDPPKSLNNIPNIPKPESKNKKINMTNDLVQDGIKESHLLNQKDSTDEKKDRSSSSRLLTNDSELKHNIPKPEDKLLSINFRNFSHASTTIDEAYQKLNELTNRSKYARENLLKIQETALQFGFKKPRIDFSQ